MSATKTSSSPSPDQPAGGVPPMAKTSIASEDATSSIATPPIADALTTDVPATTTPAASKQPAATARSATTAVPADHPIKLEARIKIEEEELLGSVTTLSSPAVRTSARVIQKLKLDLIRPASPPPADRSDVPGGSVGGRPDRNAATAGHPKTPSHSKSTKVTWSSVERNLFFDAVCEYGKDFDAIANYVNQKLRRHAVNNGASLSRAAAAVMSSAAASNSSNNNAGDASAAATGASHASTSAASTSAGSAAAAAAAAILNTKSKEHVRLLYYQTFHKVTKYLRFSDDIKKVAQELYALINYGEMRKKLVFINHKAWAKLTELVYQGTVMVRVKGKNIRIKTPACKALRRLNQMEEWQEEIKLPAKVEVWLRPASGDAWNRVQAMAMNPRVRTTVPLQKRLVSLLRTMQLRWRSKEARLSDQTLSILAERRHAAECGRPELAASTAAAATSTATTASATTPTPTTPAATMPAAHQPPPHQTHPKHVTLLDAETAQHYVQSEPRLRFSPPPQTVIHRPMVNLAEFLSSYSICLNAYEERIGVAVKGETLSAERLHSIALEGLIRSNAKRQRNDSGCAAVSTTTTAAATSGGGSERRSPEYKRARSDPELMQAPAVVVQPVNGNAATATVPGASVDATTTTAFETSAAMEGITSTVESSADESDCKDDVMKTTFRLFGSELEQLCTNASLPAAITTDATKPTTADATSTATNTTNDKSSTTTAAADKAAAAAENRAKRKDAKTLATRRRRENFRPLISESMVARIMRGWCETDIGDVTVGDLYIMFGQDFKLSLEYSWHAPQRRPAKVAAPKSEETTTGSEETKSATTVTASATAAVTTADNAEEPKPSATADADATLDDRISAGTALSNKLKHLLLLAGLAERAKEPKETKSSKKPAAAASTAALASTSAGAAASGPAAAPVPNCQCGHFCDKSGGGRANNGGSPRSYISNKIYPSSLTDNGLFRLPTPTGAPAAAAGGGSGVGMSPAGHGASGGHSHGGRFGPTPLDAYRMNLSQARYKQNRWLRARNMRITSKQVVVQRLLPLQPGAAQTYDVIRAPDGTAAGGAVAALNGFGQHGRQHQQHLHGMLPLSPSGQAPDQALSPRAGPSTSPSATTTAANRSPYSHRHGQGLRQPRKIVLPEKTNTAAAQPEAGTQRAQKVSDRPNSSRMEAAEKANEADVDEDDDSDSIANDLGIQSLMDISLPSPTPTLSNIDDLFSYSNAPPLSPMTMLRQSPTDPRWFEENVNDFSLSSFLGQLDAAATSTSAAATSTLAAASATAATAAVSVARCAASGHDDLDATIETPRKLPLSAISCSSNSCKLPPLETSRMSSISEASVDYMSKFEEIAQSMLLQQQQQQHDD